MLYNKYILVLLMIFSSVMAVRSQMYVFAELQGSPVVNTTGWSFNGAASIGDTPGDADGFNNEIVLTIPIGNSSGGIFYNQPLNLTQCQKWTAEFEFRMFDGNGADGIALCFLETPPIGFVLGGGVGIPAAANGLKVVLDTYQNNGGIAASPEIQIRYGIGYHQFDPPFNSQPTLPNTGGSLNFLRSNSYQSARVTYDNGNISVYVNNTLYLTGYYLINFTGYLGFTSSTGGLNDMHSIRNVTIYTEQAPSDAGPDVSYCSGGSVQIGAPHNPNFIYSWSPAVGLDQTDISNPTVSLVNNGSAPITQIYTVTTTLAANPGVCPSTDNVTVTINPTPTATFTISNTFGCVGQAETITYTGNMNGAATFNWNFGGGTVISGSGIGPYQVSWPTGGMKQISLSVSKYGCTSTIQSDSIFIYNNPTSTFAMPVEVCENGEATITYTGSGTPASAYTWHFDGGTVISGANEGPYQVLWSSPGPKSVSLTVTENGCVSPQTVDSIQIHPTPVAALIVPPNMCSGDTVLIGFGGDTTSTSLLFSDWSGGATMPILTNPNLGYHWTSDLPGNYHFLFTISDHGCQSDTVFQSIQVSDIPTATFTATPEVCLGDYITLTYTGTGSPSSSYVWNYPSGTLQSGTGQGPLEISYASTGNYNISLTVSENNCTSPQQTVGVTVHAIPTSTFDVATGICVGQTSALTYTGTGSPMANYNWDFDGVEVLSGSGSGPYQLGDGNLGTFEISLQVTENGCVSPITTHTFEVLPTPNVDFSASPLLGCNPLPVNFTNLTPSQAGITYTWNFGDGGTSTQEHPTHVYNNAGLFTVTLTAANGYGCSSTETKNSYIHIIPQPIAGFSVLPEQVTMDSPMVDIVDNSQFAETYFYTMGDGHTYTIPEPTHSYTSEGEYEVTQTVSNALGCTDKAILTVVVLPYTNVFIPNSFTPTGDDLNDTWNPIISYITDFQLRIYDRWGWLVFETEDIYEGWNGRYRNTGKPMEGGVYAFKISFTELTGKSREVIGHVTLLR